MQQNNWGVFFLEKTYSLQIGPTTQGCGRVHIELFLLFVSYKNRQKAVLIWNCMPRELAGGRVSALNLVGANLKTAS